MSLQASGQRLIRKERGLSTAARHRRWFMTSIRGGPTFIGESIPAFEAVHADKGTAMKIRSCGTDYQRSL
jgi:hypothetical protein